MLVEKIMQILDIGNNALAQQKFGIDFYIAMAEFKIEYPIRQGLTEQFVSSWIVDYLVKNYHYKKRPTNGEKYANQDQ